MIKIDAHILFLTPTQNRYRNYIQRQAHLHQRAHGPAHQPMRGRARHTKISVATDLLPPVPASLLCI